MRKIGRCKIENVKYFSSHRVRVVVNYFWIHNKESLLAFLCLFSQVKWLCTSFLQSEAILGKNPVLGLFA